MKIALIGLGFMGSVHARALAGRLAAVCSSDPRRLSGDLSAVRGNLGDPVGQLDFSQAKKCHNIAEVLADPAIDAVDICLPTFMHEEVAIAALRSGKHVLVEKPIALDGESARRMIAEAEANGRVLMAAQVLRFLPPYVALRESLRRLGPVSRAWFHRRCAEPEWGGWLKDPALSGGGPFDLLIHDVDMCLHLFGPPREVSATGVNNSLHGQLFYPSGMVAVITGGWEALGAYPFRMEYSVTAEGGSVEYSSVGTPPTLYDTAARQLPLETEDGYAAEIEYFLNCCQTGTQPDRCPPQESAQSVDLMRLLLEARPRQGEKIACNL
jgi:predicted dehydrogenase